MTRYGLAAVLSTALLIVACGKDSPTAPTPTPTPTPTPVPTPVTYTITGIVSSAAGGPIQNATVTAVDGSAAGRSAGTDGSGRYTLDGLRFEGFSVAATAPGFAGVSRGAALTNGVTTATMNFTLLPANPFSRTGVGNTVFDMPTYITRVGITGTYTGSSSNFIIRIGGRLVVNELVGTAWNMTRYEGVHLISGGGVVEVTNSSGVSWSFVEQR